MAKLSNELPRTQALWFVYVIKRTRDGTRERKTENSAEIDQINPRKGNASHRTAHSAWVQGSK
jgi:hypothetical protein